jgi:hypothetical protein
MPLNQNEILDAPAGDGAPDAQPQRAGGRGGPRRTRVPIDAPPTARKKRSALAEDPEENARLDRTSGQMWGWVQRRRGRCWPAWSRRGQTVAGDGRERRHRPAAGGFRAGVVDRDRRLGWRHRVGDQYHHRFWGSSLAGARFKALAKNERRLSGAAVGQGGRRPVQASWTRTSAVPESNRPRCCRAGG